MRPALNVVSTQDPERQALAAAIANAAPAKAEVEEARATAQAGRNALEEAIGAVPAAERAVAGKARLIENPAGDRSELRRSRQTVADAVDDLEIAKEVARRTELAAVDAERSIRYVTNAVKRAADTVIVSGFNAALEAAETAGRGFARLTFAAAAIAEAGDAYNGERTRLVGSVAALNAHLAFRGDAGAAEAVRQAAQGPWNAAREALLVDAEALLPEVGA